jgi:hypothetical protein
MLLGALLLHFIGSSREGTPMTITKDQIGGLIFLSFSLAYGYYANQIALIPGDEFQPFHARTLPNFLAVLGSGLALLQLLTATKSRYATLSLAGYDFWLMGKLLLLMVAFSLALKWVGFLVSTALFLAGGYWLLGERRPKVILLASVPFAISFWFLLTQMLDIYLAPGQLFRLAQGG